MKMYRSHSGDMHFWSITLILGIWLQYSNNYKIVSGFFLQKVSRGHNKGRYKRRSGIKGYSKLILSLTQISLARSSLQTFGLYKVCSESKTWAQVTKFWMRKTQYKHNITVCRQHASNLVSPSQGPE